MTEPNEMVNVRYMVDDVEEAIAFYTTFLDFEVLTAFPPAFVGEAATGFLDVDRPRHE